MTDHWGRTVLLVHEYDEAVEFYGRGLGFSVTSDSVGDGGFRLLHLGTGGGGGLWLMKAADADRHVVGNQTGGHPFGVFYVDDLTATLARLATMGTHPTARPDGDGTGRWAHIPDLYGNDIVLVELDASTGDAP